MGVGELTAQRLDAFPELRRPLRGDPDVAEGRAELVGRVGRDGLGGGDGQGVGAHRRSCVARLADDLDVEHAGRPAVVPLVDGADPPGAHDAQQAGVHAGR